jgi:hypothetical protein
MEIPGLPNSCATPISRERRPGMSWACRLAGPNAGLALLCALSLSPMLALGQSIAPPSKAPASAIVASGPSWSALSASQRAALAPLEREWSTIDAPRKAKWLEIASRFSAMPPDEQRRVHERMADWTRLSPAERGRVRLSFQEAKQLPAEERQARWEAYQALTEEERKALAQRAQPKRDAAPPQAATTAPLAPGLPKQNTAATNPSASTIKAVSPTAVQAKPGATTTPMTKSPTPPTHQQPGEPKIAAGPGQVDRSTLLPREGPQAATAPTAATKKP